MGKLHLKHEYGLLFLILASCLWTRMAKESIHNLNKVGERYRDVLFEYHRAVVSFGWAVRPVRSLSTL